MKETKQVNTKVAEVKPVEAKKEKSILDAWDYTEFEANHLSLSQALKDEINEQDLDWRFINSASYRKSGNRHRSAWKPYNTTSKSALDSFKGVDPEGIITRGDLILAVRPKTISAKHKKRIAEKNARYSAHSKQAASELRKLASEAGVSDSVRVHEGYEDNG